MPGIASVGHWNRLLAWRPPGTTPTQRTVRHRHDLDPLPRWSNQALRLYHGTLEASARSIESRGVSVSYGRARTNFGPGFYTTSDPVVAAEWARAREPKRHRPRVGVVAADLDRDALATLSWLAFARGDKDADDFWSFVAHCRAGARHHRPSDSAEPLYDVVIGPVAAILKERICMPNADQISFHTPAAEAVLNSVRWRFV